MNIDELQASRELDALLDVCKARDYFPDIVMHIILETLDPLVICRAALNVVMG